MSHPRREILSDVLGRMAQIGSLAVLASPADHVFENPDAAIDERRFPAVAVTPAAEEVEVRALSGSVLSQPQDRAFQFDVTAMTTDPSGLDQMALEIEHILFATPLGDVTQLERTDFDRAHGQKPVYAARLRFQTEYQTQSDNPVLQQE